MAEDEDPWRERGRAAVVGLILAPARAPNTPPEKPSRAWRRTAGACAHEAA